jgi:hypothetical protein
VEQQVPLPLARWKARHDDPIEPELDAEIPLEEETAA